MISPDVFLSIIMPTRNRIAILKGTYQAVLQTIQNIQAEIIIINDDITISANDLGETIGINPDNTNVFNNTRPGVSAARNYGASLAKGHLLLFLDDDVIIQQGNIKRIIFLHNLFNNILLSPTWIYAEEIQQYFLSNPFGKFRLKYDVPATQPQGKAGSEMPGYPGLYYEDTLSSFCLSIKKDLYLSLNGMDETFLFGFEDQEFTARAKTLGYSLILDMTNVLYHNELHRLKPDVWLKRQYYGIQGFIPYAWKNPEKRKMSLWFENTPINKNDSVKIKLKKIVKRLLANNFCLTAIKGIRLLLESMKAPYNMLEKIYLLQSGLYLYKGFSEAYKRKISNDSFK